MNVVQEGAPVELQQDPLLALPPGPYRAEFFPYGFAVSVAMPYRILDTLCAT